MKTIDGHQFECTQCGKCCKWDGVVNLTPEDISRLAKHEGIEEQEYIDKYTNDGDTLKDKENSKECIYLKDNLCGVWDKKPEQCEKFPTKYTPKCPGFEKTDRSASMSKYTAVIKLAQEKMANSEDYLKTVSDNLYRDLNKGVKSSNVTTMAIEAGIDSYLSDSTVKIASLDDLFAFDRVDKSHLIHKSTHDLWSIDTDKNGTVQITRQFDASGEPIKG
jgi:Fe-S-cluster containining protein